MLSTFPTTFSGESFLGNPFSSFESGFPPWEYYDPPFLFNPPSPPDEPVVFSPQSSQEPVSSNSGSDTSNPAPSPDSGEPNQTQIISSGSDDHDRDKTNPLGPIIDERKRRRMMSNRESARRSRKRKQKHLENLSNQANRLMVANRELTNRLRLVMHQTQEFRRENEFLRAEAAVLRQRLWDYRQLLLVLQLRQQLLNPTAWSCTNDVASIHY